MIALWRVLLWQILEPLLYVSIDRIAAFLGLAGAPIRFDIPALAILLSQLILIAAAAILAVREDTLRSRKFWLLALALVVFLTVAGLSRYWSVRPATTVKRFWFLAAATYGGVFIGAQFRRREILRLYEILSVLLVLGSYALILKYPKFATGPDYDGFIMWTGMLMYKGYAGSIMAFAVTVFLLRIATWRELGWPRRICASTFLGMALVMVYKSNSATAQIACLASVITFLLTLGWIRWRNVMAPRHYKRIAAFGAVLVLLALFGTPAFLGSFGREMTFTGRIPLWRELLSRVVAVRPLVGWGFGDAFWLSEDVQRIWQVITWKPGTAHSGFMEVLLDTGMLGFTAVVSLLGITIALVVRYLRLYPFPDSLLFPTWLVLVVLVNVGENLLGTYELFFWLALVIIFSHTAKDAVASHSRLPPIPAGSGIPSPS